MSRPAFGDDLFDYDLEIEREYETESDDDDCECIACRIRHDAERADSVKEQEIER